MTKDKSRIQSCVDHINTAVDVDPWAKELVIEMGAEILKQLNNSNESSLTQKTLDVPDTNVGDSTSRQAAIDILATMQGRCTSKAALIQNSKIWQQIKDLPSAQPDIIHCKDCKHWREGTAFSYCDKLHGMGVLDALDYMTTEDDYCSMAERMEDG